LAKTASLGQPATRKLSLLQSSSSSKTVSRTEGLWFVSASTEKSSAAVKGHKQAKAMDHRATEFDAKLVNEISIAAKAEAMALIDAEAGMAIFARARSKAYTEWSVVAERIRESQERATLARSKADDAAQAAAKADAEARAQAGSKTLGELQGQLIGKVQAKARTAAEAAASAEKVKPLLVELAALEKKAQEATDVLTDAMAKATLSATAVLDRAQPVMALLEVPLEEPGLLLDSGIELALEQTAKSDVLRSESYVESGSVTEATAKFPDDGESDDNDSEG